MTPDFPHDSIADLLGARGEDDHPALLFGDQRMSWREFVRAARGAAGPPPPRGRAPRNKKKTRPPTPPAPCTSPHRASTPRCWNCCWPSRRAPPWSSPRPACT
ncbi:hypothetical protein, partial [Nocardia farcinica]|uniref:hypothetical protein n=1 Tax=Nocardia farcinica TaxID=37329 RepID=UPI0024582548